MVRDDYSFDKENNEIDEKPVQLEDVAVKRYRLLTSARWNRKNHLALENRNPRSFEFALKIMSMKTTNSRRET